MSALYRWLMACKPSSISRDSMAWALTCLAAEICSEKNSVMVFRLSYRRSIMLYCKCPTRANTPTARGTSRSM